jgi:hypothetical protein
MGYQYRGKLRGEADPWNTPEPESKPDPKPQPVKRKPQKPRKDAAQCGTKSGHKRHQRLGEPACGPCKAAKADYDRDWRAGRTGRIAA